MTRRAYFTDKVVKLAAPLSNAVRTGNLLFVSGITPYDLERNVAAGDLEAQTRRVMENAKTILEEAGSSLDQVIKATIILVEVRDFQKVYDIWRNYFDEPYPALTTVVCGLVRPEFMLEIEFVAEID